MNENWFDFGQFFTTKEKLDEFLNLNGGIPCRECIVQPTCFEIDERKFGLRIHKRCNVLDEWLKVAWATPFLRLMES